MLRHHGAISVSPAGLHVFGPLCGTTFPACVRSCPHPFSPRGRLSIISRVPGLPGAGPHVSVPRDFLPPFPLHFAHWGSARFRAPPRGLEQRSTHLPPDHHFRLQCVVVHTLYSIYYSMIQAGKLSSSPISLFSAFCHFVGDLPFLVIYSVLCISFNLRYGYGSVFFIRKDFTSPRYCRRVLYL